jgi:hypothetical protein
VVAVFLTIRRSECEVCIPGVAGHGCSFGFHVMFVQQSCAPVVGVPAACSSAVASADGCSFLLLASLQPKQTDSLNGAAGFASLLCTYLWGQSSSALHSKSSQLACKKCIDGW